jgi:hypothetical protein
MATSKKRSAEILLCLLAFTLIPILLATNEIMEAARDGYEIELWVPFFKEFSSALVVLALIPALLWVDQRIPIATRAWPLRLLVHLPLSVVFSSVHIAAMYSIRNVVFSQLGKPAEGGDLWWIFVFEYRKDFAAYFSVLLVIYAYREISRLRLGEAQLSAPQNKQNDTGILVSKSGLFHFIEPVDIHWVEAAGNYVELHVGNETYMLRSTMKEIETRLGNQNFARVHRSAIVNRDEVKRVSPAMNGDKTILLNSGHELRLSRRYKQNLEFQAAT